MVDYSATIPSLVETRKQSQFDYIDKEAKRWGDSQERVAEKKEYAEKVAEFETMLFAGVAKIVQEKGADLFDGKSPEEIEARVRDGLLKDGTLVEKTGDGKKYTEYKDGSFYNPNNATLYSAAVNIPRHAFSTEIEKLPEAQKQSEAQNLNDASGNSLGATGQALYALRALEKFGNDGQTRTEAVQHGGMITVFDPDSMKDGIYQDMKHYDKQPNGAYAEITHEEFLANAKGKQSSPAEVKIYNDEKGHFAVKTKDGPIHLNANTGKQYSQEQLGQLSTNKALGDYKQAGQQVVQSMSAERRQ